MENIKNIYSKTTFHTGISWIFLSWIWIKLLELLIIINIYVYVYIQLKLFIRNLKIK